MTESQMRRMIYRMEAIGGAILRAGDALDRAAKLADPKTIKRLAKADDHLSFALHEIDAEINLHRKAKRKMVKAAK